MEGHSSQESPNLAEELVMVKPTPLHALRKRSTQHENISTPNLTNDACGSNGEAPNDGAEHEVVNAHEPEPTRSGSGAGQRSINSFLSGAASENEWSAGAPGRKKQKQAAETEHVGCQYCI